jgi:hypothetical protein
VADRTALSGVRSPVAVNSGICGHRSRGRSSLLRHGRCFVPPAASASRSPPRPSTQTSATRKDDEQRAVEIRHTEPDRVACAARETGGAEVLKGVPLQSIAAAGLALLAVHRYTSGCSRTGRSGRGRASWMRWDTMDSRPLCLGEVSPLVSARLSLRDLSSAWSPRRSCRSQRPCPRRAVAPMSSRSPQEIKSCPRRAGWSAGMGVLHPVDLPVGYHPVAGPQAW